MIVEGYELKEGEEVIEDYVDGGGRYIEIENSEGMVRWFSYGRWCEYKYIVIRMSVVGEVGKEIDLNNDEVFNEMVENVKDGNYVIVKESE